MTVKLLCGDARQLLKELPAGSVHTCITSPPYFGLRSYLPEGHADKNKEVGLETTVDEYVNALVAVFREVRRVLRDDATLWLNLGDSYCWTDKWGGGSNVGKQTVAEDGPVPSFAIRSKRQYHEGIKPKDLIGIPWTVAFALRADGWWLRQDVVWHKLNAMPESVRDRCTKAHEYVFLLSKSERYYFDSAAMQEPAVADHGPGNRSHKGHTAYEAGDERMRTKVELIAYSERQRSKRNNFARETKYSSGEHGQSGQHRLEREDVRYKGTRNKRSVWTIATQPFAEAHFATMPPTLAATCIKAGCPEDGTVLDPFGGAGTVGLVADRLQRNAILIELNPIYVDMTRRRITSESPLFSEIE